MDRDAILEAVRQQLPAKRWNHTLGVMDTAVALTGRFGGDAVKADLASLLHDYCKYWSVERQAAVLPPEETAALMRYDKALLHAPAAAVLAERDFGVKDAEVLNAIRYHTSGRAQMTLLDKIVCLADYIEPGRDFPEVERIRELAEISLEEALVAGFDSTITYLISRKLKVYPETFMARNAILEEIQSGGKS